MGGGAGASWLRQQHASDVELAEPEPAPPRRVALDALLECRVPDAADHARAALVVVHLGAATATSFVDQTYGHLAPDADEWELGRLDAFDARENAEGGHILGTGD
jgi:hypothetical protein